MPWIRDHPEGALLTVWMVPGASRTEIQGIHDGALRIRVSAPAEGGKANKALVALVADAVGGKVSLIRGMSSRRKTLLLHGIEAERGRSTLQSERT